MMILGPRAYCKDNKCPDYPHEVACTHCGEHVHDGARMGPVLPEGGNEDRRQGSFSHGGYQYRCGMRRPTGHRRTRDEQ